MIGKNNLPIFFIMGVYMKYRIVSFLLIFLILFMSIFNSFTYVYATDNYGYTYEQATEIVSKHGIIYSNDNTPMFIYSSATGKWSASRFFWTETYTDKELIDILSSDNFVQYAVTKAKYEGMSGQLCKALGYASKGVSDFVTGLISKDNTQFSQSLYDDDNGLTILSDSVDKLRKQLKEQYYNSIGLYVLESSGTPQELLSSVKTLYEHEEDFQSDYADIKDRDYVFACKDYKGVSLVFRMIFDDEPSYIYCNGKEIFDYDSNISSNLVVINKSNDIIDRNYVKYYYRHSNIKPENMGATFSNINNEISNFHLVIHDNRYSYGSVYFYSDNNKTINIFKSYEALYNFQHGSQTAYVSSKIEETGKDIQISIDDMNTNISNKMDELIDSINKKKDGMSSDELQNAIDKGLESISGKIDDIGNNTEQTNNKLDDLISIMREQNIILSDILGVTNRIADSVSDDKEDKNYTINDIVPHFNKCFTAVKNMVLFGTSSFDDTGTQSFISVDNDVGIAVYADDVEDNVKDYHNGILGKFPFSVPYQLYEWLQVLQCEPKTPEFKYNYGYLVGKKDSEETIIQFDLSNYNDWANVSRSFLKLSFTLALAVGVYRKFKGEI
jgi:Skp family chaperone for outer membrane proteins